MHLLFLHFSEIRVELIMHCNYKDFVLLFNCTALANINQKMINENLLPHMSLLSVGKLRKYLNQNKQYLKQKHLRYTKCGFQYIQYSIERNYHYNLIKNTLPLSTSFQNKMENKIRSFLEHYSYHGHKTNAWYLSRGHSNIRYRNLEIRIRIAKVVK